MESINSFFETNCLSVNKEKLAENEYNLTGDRYRTTERKGHQKWPMVKMGEVCEISSGNSAPQDDTLFKNGKYPFFRTSDVGKVHLSDNLINSNDYLNEEGIKGLKIFPKGTILFPKSGASTFLNHRVIIGVDGYVSSHLATIIPDQNKALSKYIYRLLMNIDAKNLTADQNYPSLKLSEISNIKIPLPPLEVQREIVAEIEGYQKIIDGARQVVNSWKPKIDIDPDWPMVKLGATSINIIDGDRGENYPKKEDFTPQGHCLFLNTSNVRKGYFNFDELQFVNREKDVKLRKGKLSRNDIVLTSRGTIGNIALYDKSVQFENIRINSGMLILRVDIEIFDARFLIQLFLSDVIFSQINRIISGSAQPQLPVRTLNELQIPLPPLKVQQEIVAKIEAERKMVDGCRELIKNYELKIKNVIDKVWEE